MSAIALIIFGLVGWYAYYSVKHEGGYWIPKILLNTGAFVGFLWGIRFIYPYVYEPFIKSTSALGQLVKTGVVSISYLIIYFACMYATYSKWIVRIEEKIEERVGKDPYKTKDKLTPEQEQMQVYKEALILDEIMEKDKKEDKKEDE